MPDPKQSTSAAAKVAAASPAVVLAPASESGDPAVHKLLADLQTARSNGDADGLQAAVGALADLGFEAS